MLFNSFVFILLFLPVCLTGYFGLNHYRKYEAAKAFLLGMSLWFYGYFHPAYLLILIGSIAVNYILYRLIRKSRSREAKEPDSSKRGRPGTGKAYMLAGVILNLAVLGIFKYTDFFLDNINGLFRSGILLPEILLPLGISFFTFQQVGFLADTYHGEAGEYSLLDYALFVTFFPQLIAGPIVTHEELIPQLADPGKKHLRADNFSAGCVSFITGLSKKILIADAFGCAVDYGYADISALNAAGAAVVMLSYYFQIYFDFSGYSDMAIGLGKMFNLKLPVNFDSPYRAKTVREHWNRWHMTLTRFFTKYVYIPLGGSRRGKFCTYRNVMIVFLLSGIWHGAGWGFAVWGLLNGAGIVLCRIFEKQIRMLGSKKTGGAVLWFLNMLFVSLSWIFFRSEDLHTAGSFLKRLFTGGAGLPSAGLLQSFRQEEFWYVMKLLHLDRGGYGDLLLCGGYLFAAFVIVLAFKNVQAYLKKWKPGIRPALAYGLLFLWSIVNLSGVSTFLYYNF